MGKSSMKRNRVLLMLTLVCSLLLVALMASPVPAADNARLEELQRKIEEQQRRLEAQQAMLEELSKQMEELKQAGQENHNDAKRAQKNSNDTDVNVFGMPFVTSADGLRLIWPANVSENWVSERGLPHPCISTKRTCPAPWWSACSHPAISSAACSSMITTPMITPMSG